MKVKTSRAYILSHLKLRAEVFYNWSNFDKFLRSGLSEMRHYLLDLWNGIDLNNPEIELVDKNKEVTLEDFNITMNSKGDILIFYITFPEIDAFQAQAKCVAIAITPNRPRYFTMEISKDVLTDKVCYIFGEWVPKDNTFAHRNYGKIPNNTVDSFASRVFEAL